MDVYKFIVKSKLFSRTRISKLHTHVTVLIINYYFLFQVIWSSNEASGSGIEMHYPWIPVDSDEVILRNICCVITFKKAARNF